MMNYIILRDKNGAPRFDDWDGLPPEAKEGYRQHMTEAEKQIYTMEGYHGRT